MGKLFRYLYQVDEEKEDKWAIKGRKWKNVASVDVQMMCQDGFFSVWIAPLLCDDCCYYRFHYEHCFDY